MPMKTIGEQLREMARRGALTRAEELDEEKTRIQQLLVSIDAVTPDELVTMFGGKAPVDEVENHGRKKKRSRSQIMKDAWARRRAEAGK